MSLPGGREGPAPHDGRAFVAMGSNLGDSRAEMRRARTWLGTVCRRLRSSSLYRTAPVGGPPGQDAYLNAVALLEGPAWGPRQLLQELLAYEVQRGRDRGPSATRWGPRVIDLDLLAYDEVVVDDPLLSLPHPRLHQREFVLVPLGEVAPDWRHPDSSKTPAELLGDLRRAADEEPDVVRLESW